jgi:hypothetical protein
MFGTFAVTVPEIAGMEGIETTLPLTAVRISVIACDPKETTVWAGICWPPVTMVESVVADWLPSKMESAITQSPC